MNAKSLWVGFGITSLMVARFGGKTIRWKNLSLSEPS